MPHFDSLQYETLLREAVAALPDAIRSALADVVILVEDEPPPGRQGILLGLYQGIPATAWGRDVNGKLPDTITLFRSSIERVAPTPEDIPHLVRETLWHEIAHHFGFDHDRIDVMEKRWREKRGGNKDE